MNNQPIADLDWRDERIPISRQFDDPYFSLDNGLAETRHVFLDGNDLPERFGGEFVIGELGFGTGLNFLTVWQAWLDHGAKGSLNFISFEAFPMALADMQAALRAFPQVSDRSDELTSQYDPTVTSYRFGNVTLEIVMGDVRETLPQHPLSADAWFLDGFSPAKNPEMWGADLMYQIGTHTKSGGTAATYTAAGFVRRGLEEAGFEVTRTPGFGRKRHMTRATKR